MFWVLQKNLFNEAAFADLLTQLERQDVDHAIVTIIPFIHEMSPDINPIGNVYVCGSTGIGKIAKAKGWTPGYFDENLDYRLLFKHYGEEMLNYGAQVAPMRSIIPFTNHFFIRPVSDKKTFAGTVMDVENFNIWRKQVIALDDDENSLTTMTADDLIVMSELHHICAEFRFYVVDGKVITGSMYKYGDKVFYNSHVDQCVYDYAQKMVDIWQPNRAFVLDIAEIDHGEFKVLEINAINSSGFYACDMGKYVNAINSMTF